MKEAPGNMDSVAAPNPRREVESWIISGVSKEHIFWMLESIYNFQADQCQRLYSLVESEYYDHSSS